MMKVLVVEILVDFIVQFDLYRWCSVISVCISVPLWQIRIFGYSFHAKSGYPDFYVQAPYRAIGPLYCFEIVNCIRRQPESGVMPHSTGQSPFTIVYMHLSNCPPTRLTSCSCRPLSSDNVVPTCRCHNFYCRLHFYYAFVLFMLFYCAAIWRNK